MNSGSVEVVPRGYRVGEWEVTDLIGAGGWGTVYAGRRADADDVSDAGDADETGETGDHGTAGDDGSGSAADGETAPTEVALKFLPTAGLAPRQARGLVETGRREAEFSRRTRHPRLIRLFDSITLDESAGSAFDGAVVLVMERAERSLRERLEASSDPGRSGSSPSGEEPLSVGEGARLLTEICEGLAHLHELGWVHGDLKPDNVLLMADGSVRLADFGLAVELTGTHAYVPPLGTLDYLPPERRQASLGERGVQVRQSTDIWALGVMIHQVFTGGVLPFPGATPAARGAAAQEYADGRAPLRMDLRMPPFWRELAADCLSPAHTDRAAHTAESLLGRIRAEQARALAPPGTRRRRRVLAAAALTVVAGGVGAAGWLQFDDDDRSSGGGATPGRSGATASVVANASIKVYNAERSCHRLGERHNLCSLGLAIDPSLPYDIDNVVRTRVWDGDVLTADCQFPQGMPVADEAGTRSVRWYRVRLTAEKGRTTAWLPAVRTKDRPALAECPARPSPS
ncbi:serine/threonine-protein kinase [Streptomyces sp. WI04-05B]|uniref:serine/threonine-protein kinase n=1 Tax=Streptomyces TaxID=1883 RepID=UPI0029ADFB8A|nr:MULTISPECIES: serine/threonine-protein kinase [unclassified Streptomyces]MDX2543511.1 serine/threonine-protein kinase [Streptomyces sp. WI04-05B]MDX2583001.1 serine/threonine-protein kinase [Streptomyces sp. WI04-05A]